MAKKKNNEDYQLDNPGDLLEDYGIVDEEFLEDEYENKKNYKKFKIQTVEEYLLEIGYGSTPPRKLYKDYPDLHKVKLDKKDDISSEYPGVEALPETQLYASLLTYKTLKDYLEKINGKK